MNPPFNYTAQLNGEAYHQTCPILHNNKKLHFKFHRYSTNLKPQEQLKSHHDITCHSLVFQLEGETHINWNEHKDVVIKAGEMYFLPRGASITGYIVGGVSFIVAIIEREMTNKELDDLRKMKNFETFSKYKFKAMTMKKPMVKLAESVRNYLVSGVNCTHLHEAKFNELYVILHWYYSYADNAQLFYPMALATSKFSDYILDNYHITTSIGELVSRANMSRSTFDRKFKEIFKTTPLKWIDEHTRQLIISKASEPNVTVKDLMYEVGILNPSQFTTLCRRLCGTTPSELIRSK